MARIAAVVRMPPPFRRRTTKEPRRPRGPAAALEERIEEIMDRVQQAGDNQVERVAALSDCARLGIELPAVELLDLMPEWSALLH